MCGQQKLRPACAYVQTDKSLCCSLKYSMTVKLLTKPHLRFLSLIGGCTGSSESTLIKVPHCWKSGVMAQIIFPHLYSPVSGCFIINTNCSISQGITKLAVLHWTQTCYCLQIKQNFCSFIGAN